MSDKYLWDRSEPADPGIQRIEHLLGEFRLSRKDAPTVRRAWIPQAMAACLLAGFALWQTTAPAPEPLPAWKADGRALATGEIVRTAGTTSMVLFADSIGRIEVSPSTELRIAESRVGRHRFDLRAGTIHALIWAPPQQFEVDTPSARAIDLGCQYTLSVGANGEGVLDVETGWVAFLHKGRESFVPAGARCLTSNASGPGTPFLRDAPERFIKAVTDFDRRPSEEALRLIVDNATTRDGLTLWHLLTRVEGAQRLAVFRRFAELVVLPSEVTPQQVLQSDAAAIDLCWNALGLESTEWWRGWRRNW